MSIEHSILAVISFTPATGYDIKSEFETKASSLYWGMSYGSIYPKLKNLEENGYIYSVSNEHGGRQKKHYELTKKGWIELENWLSEAPSYPSVKDELFMKLAAWHSEMDEDLLVSHLEKRKEYGAASIRPPLAAKRHFIYFKYRNDRHPLCRNEIGN